MLPKHQYMKACTRHWGLIYGIIESRAYLPYIYEHFFATLPPYHDLWHAKVKKKNACQSFFLFYP